MQKVLDFLDEQQIPFVLHEHPAVFTCEEAEQHCGDIPGLPCKNLFLRDKRKKRYLLAVLPAEKRMNLKHFGEFVGDKMGFASAEDLMEKLGLEVGAVTPFGLLNDEGEKVELFVDKEVYDAEIVSFHPNVNTATLELPHESFVKFLEVLPHDVRIAAL
jgi:Ala-tRNA(Pro) deacylase